MEKRISHQQFQSVKAVAKACEPIYRKKAALEAKMQKLVQESIDYDDQISALEAGIVKYVGFHVDDLLKRVVEVDEDNKKSVKYVPTDAVTYDAKTRQYVVIIPEGNVPSENTEEFQRLMDAVEKEGIRTANKLIDEALQTIEEQHELDNKDEETPWDEEVLVTPASPEAEKNNDSEWDFD